MKYSCNKSGANYLKYLLNPTQLFPILIYNYKKSIQVNPTSCLDIYSYLSDFLMNQNIQFTTYSSHLYFLIKNSNLDYNNLLLDIFIFIKQLKEILYLYESLKKYFKNIVLYSELGVILILPDYISDYENNTNHPIVLLTFLLDNDFLHKDSNIFCLEKPKSDSIESIIFDKSKSKNTKITSDYLLFLEKNFDTFSKIKNKLPIKEDINYLDLYLF